jgi:hypothetical protein
MRMNGLASPVFVSGAAALSAYGFEWRGLGRAVKDQRLTFTPSAQLADSHPNVLASELPAIPSSVDAGDARGRKLMSRGARLAAIALKRALGDACWDRGREEIGFFLGVGASGGSMTELTEMLLASMNDGRFSLARFGSEGLAACNPLFAFQLMNNFTLCHGAILEGVAGPNSAFYSRGNGTVVALFEAAHAIAEGDCERALAGGADSALHPVTWAELVREGSAKNGLIPGEGAGILALAREARDPLAVLERCEFRGPGALLSDLLAPMLAGLESLPIDLVVLAPWGDVARAALRKVNEASFPRAAVLDVSECLGDSLAATPALAWVAALDLIVAKEAKKALVLNAGTDGGVGAVLLGSLP